LAEVEELSERIFGVDPFLGFPPADTALMHQLIKCIVPKYRASSVDLLWQTTRYGRQPAGTDPLTRDFPGVVGEGNTRMFQRSVIRDSAGHLANSLARKYD
jgi:hypothetical protein